MKKYLLIAFTLGICCNVNAQTFSSVAPSGQTLYYRINTWDTSATLTYVNGGWEGAYQGLTGQLVIPESVSYSGYTYPVAVIDSGCFRGNTGLTSVTIPARVRRLYYNVFAGCTGLTTINYNADSCALGWSGAWDAADNAGIFEGCINVATVNIGDSVRYVPPFIFYDCVGLQTLNVGKSVIRFHNDALPYDPVNLTTLNFNARNCGKRYGSSSSNEYQYYDYTSWEYRYYKESSPFEGCTNLTNVNIGDEVEGLFTEFLWGCTGLSSVVIPDAVTSMKYCFVGCTNLNSVTIGNSVEQIQGTFDYCSHLTTINVRAEYPPTCDEYTFYGVPAYADIIVPCGTAYRYELSDYWNAFSRITEDCDGIDDVECDSIRVYAGCGQIRVDGADGQTVRIYDMYGRMVANNNLPIGIYLVKIDNNPAQKVLMKQ